MKLIGITLKELGKEYGIYKKQPKCKEPYLTKNGKFLCWLPVRLVKNDDGSLSAFNGWNQEDLIG